MIEKISILGENAWSGLYNLPARFWRMVVHLGQLFAVVTQLHKNGLQGILAWAGRLIVLCLDLLGVWELLQMVWGLLFRMRKLTDVEIEASLLVHPPGLIPYHLVRVDEGSWIGKIAGYFSGYSFRAVATAHILHVAPGESLATMVHELSHVAQYEQVGSVYMPEALHAQFWGEGYKYTHASTRTLLYPHFWEYNREQQALICEDYYKAVTVNSGPWIKELQPLIDEMREGRF